MQLVVQERIKRNRLLGPGQVCDIVDVAVHVDVGSPSHLFGPLDLHPDNRSHTCVHVLWPPSYIIEYPSRWRSVVNCTDLKSPLFISEHSWWIAAWMGRHPGSLRGGFDGDPHFVWCDAPLLLQGTLAGAASSLRPQN